MFHLGWQNGWTFYPTDQKKPPEHADSEFTGDNGDNIPELWKDFLDAIKNDPRLFTTIVTPSSEGMSVSVKIK